MTVTVDAANDGTTGSAEILDADVNQDTVIDTVVSVTAKVKSLNPGKGSGRQNNAFASAACVAAP